MFGVSPTDFTGSKVTSTMNIFANPTQKGHSFQLLGDLILMAISGGKTFFLLAEECRPTNSAMAFNASVATNQCLSNDLPLLFQKRVYKQMERQGVVLW